MTPNIDPTWIFRSAYDEVTRLVGPERARKIATAELGIEDAAAESLRIKDAKLDELRAKLADAAAEITIQARDLRLGREDLAGAEHDLAKLIIAIEESGVDNDDLVSLAYDARQNGREGWVETSLDMAVTHPSRQIRESLERASAEIVMLRAERDELGIECSYRMVRALTAERAINTIAELVGAGHKQSDGPPHSGTLDEIVDRVRQVVAEPPDELACDIVEDLANAPVTDCSDCARSETRVKELEGRLDAVRAASLGEVLDSVRRNRVDGMVPRG